MEAILEEIGKEMGFLLWVCMCFCLGGATLLLRVSSSIII